MCRFHAPDYVDFLRNVSPTNAVRERRGVGRGGLGSSIERATRRLPACLLSNARSLQSTPSALHALRTSNQQTPARPPKPHLCLFLLCSPSSSESCASTTCTRTAQSLMASTTTARCVCMHGGWVRIGCNPTPATQVRVTREELPNMKQAVHDALAKVGTGRAGCA